MAKLAHGKVPVARHCAPFNLTESWATVCPDPCIVPYLLINKYAVTVVGSVTLMWRSDLNTHFLYHSEEMIDGLLVLTLAPA